MYPLIESLGNYVPKNYEERTPPLHNLLYLNKEAYKASIDRYKLEECKLSISQYEFNIYFDRIKKENISSRIMVFKFYFSDSGIIRMTVNKLNKLRHSRYPIWIYTTDGYTTTSISKISHTEMYPITSREFLYTNNITFSLLGEFYNGDFKINNIFVNNLLSDTLDINTLYQILTYRELCNDLIEDYAGNIILKIFDSYVSILSSDELLPMLNVYLYYNALSITDEYDAIGILPKKYFHSEHDDIVRYISDTEEIRNELIDYIRSYIIDEF